MENSLNKTIKYLRVLQTGIICLGRLQALAILAHGTLASKAKHAELAHVNFRHAATINSFLNEYYRTSVTQFVAWPSEHNPINSEILSGGLISIEKLEHVISELTVDIAVTVEKLKVIECEQPLLAPVKTALSSVFSHFSDSTLGGSDLNIEVTATNKVTKAFAGPICVPLDDSFVPTYSLLQKAVPGYGDTAKEVVPYFWGLAIRESLAADLCALSIVEYDGLPLQFYIDMSKQSWDEMRHSRFFFDKAVELLPELLNELQDNDSLLDNVRQFIASGKGLPIPKERNLYEAILNASLTERLILLHRDTETPGIMRIKEKISSPYSAQRPWLVDALTIVMRDEVTHASFGKTWLEYILPDENEREDLIQDTELLRGVYLLTSFAHHGNQDLTSLLSKYASGEIAPTSVIATSNKQNPGEALIEIDG